MHPLKPTLILCLFAITALVASVMAQTYWPNDPNKYPEQRGTHYGEGYVVGTNDAAVADSIAIGGNDRNKKAIVLDASGSVQIGEGTNTTDNTFAHNGNFLSKVFIDATTNTDTSAFSAPMAGCVLVGQYFGADEAWVSIGTGTNWNRLGQATITPASLDGDDMNPVLAGDSLTLNGTQLDVDPAAAGSKGAIYLPNISQSVKSEVEVITSGDNTNRYSVANLSVSLTPKSATSKVRIQAVIHAETDAANMGGLIYLVRNGTDIGSGNADGSKLSGIAAITTTTSSRGMNQVSIDFLDSPGVTTNCTYSIEVSTELGSKVYFNQTAYTPEGDDTSYYRVSLTITAEEIYQ